MIFLNLLDFSALITAQELFDVQAYEIPAADQEDFDDLPTFGEKLALLETNYITPLSIAEKQAVGTVKNYLGGKYDMAVEIDRFVNATAFDNSATYSEGDTVLVSGVFYQSLADSNTGNAPGSSPLSWSAIERNDLLVQRLVDITLYTLFGKANHEEENRLRRNRYDAAIKWLEQGVRGQEELGLTRTTDEDGEEVRGGLMRGGNYNVQITKKY